MNIWQLLKKSKIAVVPMHTTEEFQLFNTLYPSMVSGSHLLRILTLKLWLPGYWERLMGRQLSIKYMSTL